MNDEYTGMGRSAGRSRGNRDGEGAVRRAPQRERDYIDPPGRSEWVRLHDEVRTAKRVDFAMAVVGGLSAVFFCVLAAIVVAAWFGII